MKLHKQSRVLNYFVMYICGDNKINFSIANDMVNNFQDKCD